MMQSRTKRTIGLALGCSIALAFGGFGINVGVKATKDSKVAIPAEQVIASIKTAIAAKPGDVRAVEIENEGGKSICEVEILASDGKTYEVEVDVATSTVVEVEMDDDTDEDEDDQD
ncbi:MAG: peptidase [Acidobacteriota bacterium]|nr:peptidase [Acidobacteriota bacterium]